MLNKKNVDLFQNSAPKNYELKKHLSLMKNNSSRFQIQLCYNLNNYSELHTLKSFDLKFLALHLVELNMNKFHEIYNKNFYSNFFDCVALENDQTNNFI